MMVHKSDNAAFLAFLWAELHESFELDQHWYESASKGGGRIDACIELATVADAADEALTALTVELDGLPGVFHYEQMYNLAEWLVKYVNAEQELPSKDEVVTFVRDLVTEWVELFNSVDMNCEANKHG